MLFAFVAVSLLKRLMDVPKGPYVKRDGKDKFNPNFVTKLLQSFRSHPNILKLPNELFYDGELLACANKHEREKFCKWKVNFFVFAIILMVFMSGLITMNIRSGSFLRCSQTLLHLKNITGIANCECQPSFNI